MIKAYHRPANLLAALELLSQPSTIPLAGGTFINSSSFSPADVSVVDLQSLALTKISKEGNYLAVDACVTLQQLLENTHTPNALKEALKREAPLNVRNLATVAGALVSCDGRSPFATLMLAMDSKLEISTLSETQFSTQEIGIGEFLGLRPQKLISRLFIPLNATIAMEIVSRTPADSPIVCTAISHWNSGRTRLALGGHGKTPLLAMDGTEQTGIESAARNAYHEAGDVWASAEYRAEMASVLSRRALAQINTSI